MNSGLSLKAFTLAVLLTLSAGPAFAAACGTGTFETWLEDFKKEAGSKGISQAVITANLTGVTLDKAVLVRDQSQKVFSQTFEEFSGRMVPPRLTRGSNMLKQYGSVLGRIEQTYGVPGEVIVAIWGLETDYGVNLGKFQTLRSLASLAYDCRRSDLFKAELMDALRIVERGDIPPQDLRGAWAGEIGQTQILPSDYLEKGRDGDGDGLVDLRNDPADVIMTTANFLKSMGWRAGEPWMQEVRVPAEMDWADSGRENQHPRSHWAAAGVTARDGSALPSDDQPSSLVLPMGRKGPAFLIYPNFDVYLEWNQSFVYTLTAGHLAARFAGEPAYDKRNPDRGLTIEEMKQLQEKLAARGHDVGKIDGVLGTGTRTALQKVQAELGLPADGWPTQQLLVIL